MKRSPLLLIVIVALLTTTLQTLGQGTDTVSSTPATVLELRGTIGKGLAVHMHLEIRDVVRTQGSESFVVGEQYTGYYFYDKRGEHIALRGYFNAQGPGGAVDDPEVEIDEVVNGKTTAYFIGHLEDTMFKGHWDSTNPERSLPFDLRATSRRGEKR
jgi:hypothetical protein